LKPKKDISNPLTLGEERLVMEGIQIYSYSVCDYQHENFFGGFSPYLKLNPGHSPAFLSHITVMFQLPY
jgi:hypothetical protein